MPDHRLTVGRRLAFPATEVFDAWLDADSLRHWMCPGPTRSATVEVDPVVGGRFRIVMHGPDRDHEHTGEYRVIDRPRRLVFTWRYEHTDDPITLVTVDLSPQGDETEVLLTHERVARLETARSYEGGWGEILTRLAEHLEASGRER